MKSPRQIRRVDTQRVQLKKPMFVQKKYGTSKNPCNTFFYTEQKLKVVNNVKNPGADKKKRVEIAIE